MATLKRVFGVQPNSAVWRHVGTAERFVANAVDANRVKRGRKVSAAGQKKSPRDADGGSGSHLKSNIIVQKIST